MELHTLGADRGYSNYDVQELSKVLTGWTYDTQLQVHLQGRLSTSPASRTCWACSIPAGLRGRRAGPVHPGHAPEHRRVHRRKLCRYLVNDNPPPALVTQGGQRLHADRGRPAQGLLGDHLQPRVRQPARTTGPSSRRRSSSSSACCGPPTPRSTTPSDTCKELAKMGQPIYDCPDPTGYYFKAEAWMDAGVLTSRWDYSLELMRGGISRRQAERRLPRAATSR